MNSQSIIDGNLSGVEIIPSDGFNLSIVQRYHQQLDVTIEPRVHHWFAGQFGNLPTDQNITLRILSPFRKNIRWPISHVEVSKWVGLRPLLTYADPLRYESYEWFRRDAQGRWQSGDPFKSADERDAGNGETPIQQAIPSELAAQFLSEDGAYWQPWREIETVEAFPDENIFNIHHQFDAPTASVAIHVPFTYTYLQQYLERLRAAAPSGVFIDDLGLTRDGRRLEVIRVDDPADPIPVQFHDGKVLIPPTPDGKFSTRKVMLITAREHATEHTGSWVVLGVLRALMANTPEAARLRKNTTWLLIPDIDPDGSTDSKLFNIFHQFFDHSNTKNNGQHTPQEVLAYARYFRAYVSSRRPIYLATSFYCLECNEAEPVHCPVTTQPDLDNTMAFNRIWFQQLQRIGFRTGALTPWERTCIPSIPTRCHGWCSYFYGGLPLMFQVNDRYPAQRLSLAQLATVGESYPTAVLDFLETKAGKARMKQTLDFLHDREKNMELWYRTSLASSIDDPNTYDLLAMGY